MVIIFNEKFPKNLEDEYKKYYDEFAPLELSVFQKWSIKTLVDGNHSLVCAPTGSGKSLPMDFTTNFFTKKGKKVVICNPIKSLSNQRYYDFTRKFSHLTIGLITGDIKTNPTADVLIMTTEILMNYLFNNKKNEKNTLQFNIDIENELGAVVFDESHYINDADRGKNWEQCLLMLPSHIQLLLLSATLDNPIKLASFIENRHENDEKKVIITTSTVRNVPLNHYCYITTNETIFKGIKDKVLEKEIRDTTNKLLLIQNEKNIFQEKTYNIIKHKIELFKSKDLVLKRKFVLNNLLKILKETEKLPAICFIFSRKNVELAAKEITTNLLEDDSRIPYETKKYCDNIIRKLPNYNEYLQLPEYNVLVGLLEKGIGIHHSGMIPILREIVELLICEKKIKVLFATETFAIGLNCPIKTVIFTALKKFDGNNDRYLYSHEYTQAAGRAGRRGIDLVGNVIHLNNLFKIPTIIEYKTIISTNPQVLTSKLYISYSVILNILKNQYSQNTLLPLLDKELESNINEATVNNAFIKENNCKEASCFINFISKSMIYNEFQENIKQQKKIVLSIYEQLKNKENQIKILRTPINILEQYLKYENDILMINNKKKKEIKNKMKMIEDENRFFKEDIKIIYEIKEIKELLYNEEQKQLYVENYLENQINNVLNVLTKYELLQHNDMGYIKLTEDGIISSNIMEIHPILIPVIMKKWDCFKELTPIQLVGIFSCFAEIRIQEELRKNYPQNGDLKEKIENIIETFNELYNVEKELNMRTGINYDEILNYDIIIETMEWCKCDNEEKCKKFIQIYLVDKNILLGDFTKAILKINVIIKELINVAEITNKIDLLSKLKEIEPLLLKYIFTSQSLYI